MFAWSSIAASDALFLGPAGWCQSCLQAFSGDLFSLCSHHRITLSAVLQAAAKDRSSASLWNGGCAKGWERKEGHVEREYKTPYCIIASVYYSNSASEMALISSLGFYKLRGFVLMCCLMKGKTAPFQGVCSGVYIYLKIHC